MKKIEDLFVFVRVICVQVTVKARRRCWISWGWSCMQCDPGDVEAGILAQVLWKSSTHF